VHIVAHEVGYTLLASILGYPRIDASNLHQSSDIHHDKSTSDYSFENWTAPTSASANLWSFNSENPSTALLGAVMDTGAQHGATGARTY